MSTTGSTQPRRPDIRSSPSASSENVRARNLGPSSTSAAPPPAAPQAGVASPLRFDARTIHFSVNASVPVLAGLGMLPILPKHLADRACKLSLLGTVLSSGYSLYSTYGVAAQLHTYIHVLERAEDDVPRACDNPATTRACGRRSGRP
ncbi:hypothetical protein D1007_13101 [Hordeum vulgare]|nr:hypothetical protein D1007_13101 [Hordeum vulgare]